MSQANSSNRMRVGIVGTGHWAREVHLPGVMASADAVCVGLYGRSADAASAIAARHGVAQYPTFEALLDASDAVTLAVPPAVQPALATAAALAGKHLLIEKPVALQDSDA